MKGIYLRLLVNKSEVRRRKNVQPEWQKAPITVTASSAPQATISLNCLVLGDSQDHIFPVKISSLKTVGILREAIKDKKQHTFHHVEADKLSLYRTSLPDDGKLKDMLRSFHFDEPLQAMSILAKIFTDLPLEEHLHIVVQPPHEVLENASNDEGYKDILMELYDSFNCTITPMKKPPSEVAKSMQYVTNQEGKSWILDCRCLDEGPATVGPPIQLFNLVFTYFASKAFDPKHSIPPAFICHVCTAVELFAQIHSSEASRQTSLRSILQDIISFPIIFMGSADGTLADGVVLGSHGRTECMYLVVVEEKRELGDGSSDPSTQGAFSYLRIFCQPTNHTLLLKTCCPAFIIAHAGPWLTILGGVITSKCIIQQLPNFLWVPIHSTHDDDQWLHIAHVFHVLQESVGCLQSWYENNREALYDPSCPIPHPQFFPSINMFLEGGVEVPFQYQQPLEFDNTCVTYLAETKEIYPRKMVVKFITTYGVDAHKMLADAGFTSKLHYFGPIGTDENIVLFSELRMVVMDYIEGLMLSDALKQHKVPPSFVTHLRQAIAQLHDAGLVFGDLRAPNIMVTPNNKVTVQLIDFDWAGKDGEVVYPVSISSQINWPTGIEGLMPIERQHDLSNLAHIVADVEKDTAKEVCMYLVPSQSGDIPNPFNIASPWLGTTPGPLSSPSLTANNESSPDSNTPSQIPSIERSFTLLRLRRFQATHRDVQHSACLQRKKSCSSSRRPKSVARGSNSDGVYQPWHISPNTHCNGGLKNAVHSAKGKLPRRLWVGTLNTDGFRSEMRMNIDKRMRDMCDSVPVWIPDGEFESCYDEFCHQQVHVLRPCLYYAVPDAPKPKHFYENASFKQYRSVNQRFADVIVENYHEGDIIWVNDYHLLLLPAPLRSHPKTALAPIGFFLHVAFPSSENFRCLSVLGSLKKGVLGADLVGFQTANYNRHFRQTVSCILASESLPKGIQVEGPVAPSSTGGEAEKERGESAEGKKTKEKRRFIDVGVAPMGIDVNSLREEKCNLEIENWVQLLRQRYTRMKLMVERDKLDEIQGVCHRIEAFEHFLQTNPEFHGKVVLIQVALQTTEFNELAGGVSDVVAPINVAFSTLNYQLVVFLHYVGCQEGRKRALMLSEFTGMYSYSAFRSCFAVNPYNTRGTAKAIYQALIMSDEEAASRWQDPHYHVVTQTAQAFVTSFLSRCLRAHTEHASLSIDPPLVPPLDLPHPIPKYGPFTTCLVFVDLEGCLCVRDMSKSAM
ncbi:glycosyltransferase family 20-domain-containing protein [Pisolithus sp. B1]|nr:glycosyltransferase family 20-domain-containing protein [Pisolithus sp. B1]